MSEIKYEIETYVTVETALLAKEAGFDVVGRSIYHNKTIDKTWRENVYAGVLKHDYVLHDEVLRPTQTTLAKWLREKHNISVLPEHGRMSDDSFGYFCRIFTDTKNSSAQSKLFEYRRIYEEALEEGLKAALNYLLSKK